MERVAETTWGNVPNSYSSIDEEYEASTLGVGLLDRSKVGRLRLTGDDSLDLLNRLSTNKLTDLNVGQGVRTVLTSPKGRILDLLVVTKRDSHLVVMTSPQNRQKVMDWVEFYTIAEDVVVQDLTEQTAMLALIGPRAGKVLDGISRGAVPSLQPYSSTSITIAGLDALAVRTDFASLPGYDIIVQSSDAGKLWRTLLNTDTNFSIKPVGMDALEVIRIEQGVPAYDSELSEDINPLEANLMAFVSLDKGCYVGQEVVARLNTYKKVQKYLVGLSWSSDFSPAANAALFVEGKKVGWITSHATSQRLSKRIGLGCVRKAHCEPGVQLTVGTPDSKAVVFVEALPFKSE